MFCPNCGKQVQQGLNFCDGCGANLGMNQQQNMNQNYQQQNLNMNQNDVQSGKAMAILSYFGILSLIPYFSEKNNQYVRFHAVQGVNLFIVNTILMAVSSLINNFVGSLLSWPFSIASTFLWILEILGVVYAAKGEQKELPLISKIKIVKN